MPSTDIEKQDGAEMAVAVAQGRLDYKYFRVRLHFLQEKGS